MSYITGIGSRSTPEEVKPIILSLAEVLVKKGFILRSGGAEGSDSFWEEAYDKFAGQKEIYLPWKKFAKNESPLYRIEKEAFDLASTIHPAWGRLSFGGKKLHARNCYQVLGLDLKTPSSLIICWTKDAEKVGGTRTAIMLAEKYNIPVYNLASKDVVDSIMEICQKV